MRQNGVRGPLLDWMVDVNPGDITDLQSEINRASPDTLNMPVINWFKQRREA